MEPPPLAGVLPRQGPFDPHPQRLDGRVEASLAPALGRLALARTLCDVGDEARREHASAMACGITAAIEVEGGASQVRPNLPGHLLKALSPCGNRIMSVSWTGAPGAGAATEP